MAETKTAIRRIKRVDGRLKVVFMDTTTGQLVDEPDTKGYTIISNDQAEADYKSPKTEDAPVEEPPVGEVGTASSSYGSSGSFYKDRVGTMDSFQNREGASRGTGDIVADAKAAAGTLKDRVSSIKEGAINSGANIVNRVSNAVTGHDLVPENKFSFPNKPAPTVSNDPALSKISTEEPGYTPPQNGAYSRLVIPKGENMNGVDPRLLRVLDAAALRSPYKVEVRSGKREGDSRNHGKGAAVDITLTDPDTGKKLPDYQNGAAFKQYEQFAQTVKIAQRETDPSLEGIRWGGYFGSPQGPKGYGAMDLMHFDTDPGKLGMGQGSWATGLSPLMQKTYGITTSQGIDLSSVKLTPPGESPIPEIREAYKNTVTPTSAAVQDMVGTTPLSTNPLSGVDPGLQNALKQFNSKIQTTAAIPQTPLAPTTPAPMSTTPVEDVLNTPFQPSATNLQRSQEYLNSQRPADQQVDYSTPVTPVANQSFANPAMSQTMPGQAQSQQKVGTEQLQDQQRGINLSGTIPSFAGYDKGDPYTAATAQVKQANAPDNAAAIKDSFLNSINSAEGSPKYNQGFGYKEFSPTAAHPGEAVYNKEFNTTAAGMYQINAPTWNEYAAKVGATDFSNPEDQKKVAWGIATSEYAKKNGGADLLSDLMSGDDAKIANAYASVSNRWSSLPGGKQAKEGLTMDSVLNTFKTGINSSYDASVSSAAKPDITKSSFYQDASSFASKPTNSASNSGSSSVFSASDKARAAGSAAKTAASTSTGSGTGSSAFAQAAKSYASSNKPATSPSSSGGGTSAFAQAAKSYATANTPQKTTSSGTSAFAQSAAAYSNSKSSSSSFASKPTTTTSKTQSTVSASDKARAAGSAAKSSSSSSTSKSSSKK